jgi:hypothetical protein
VDAYFAVASKRDQGEYAERFLIWLRRVSPVACYDGTDLEG